jgi:hypothetical protein
MTQVKAKGATPPFPYGSKTLCLQIFLKHFLKKKKKKKKKKK